LQKWQSAVIGIGGWGCSEPLGKFEQTCSITSIANLIHVHAEEARERARGNAVERGRGKGDHVRGRQCRLDAREKG